MLILIYVLSSSIFTIWFLYLIISVNILNVNKKWPFKIQPYCIAIVIYYLYTYKYKSIYLDFFIKIVPTNINLQNGLLNIHPVIVFLIYSNIIIFWLELYTNIECYNSLYKFGTQLYYNLFLILVGILLGANWASQELNWGGFWSWDPVEIISLYFLFFIMVMFHNNTRLYITIITPVKFILFVGFVYIIIRFGVIQSIHSFVNNNNNSYIISSVLLYSMLYNLVKLYNISIFFIFENILFRYKKINIFIVYYYTLLCILYLLIFSLYILLITQYFLYKQIIIYNESTWCYLIIVTMILVIFTEKKHKFCIPHKNRLFFILYFYLIFWIYKNITFGIMLVLWYILVPIYKYQYKIIHIGFLLMYLLGHILQLNINIYTISQNINIYLVNCTNIGNHLIYNNCFESTYTLKNTLFLHNFKKQSTHILSFNILNNIFTQAFLFTKNNKIWFMFIEESLFMLFIFFIYIISIYNKYKFVLTYIEKR